MMADAFITQKSSKVRPKTRKTNLLLASVLLVACLQVALLAGYSRRIEPNANASPSSHVQQQRYIHLEHPQSVPRNSDGSIISNITFVGISYSDDTISEAAMKYLLQAACEYQIQSYILISQRTHKTTLDKKLYMFAQHLYMSLAKGGTVRQPLCTELIHINQAPNQEQLINQTKTRMESTGEIKELLSDTVPNNPLLLDNRIAKIKRVREYQRQMLRNSAVFKQNDNQSVIAILDLDMFDYPKIAKVIEVTEMYMVTTETEPKKETIDVICSNGLQRSRYWEPFPRRNYYDTFATILLPNTWPVLESSRTVPKGLLKGEDVSLSKLSQQDLLDYFLKEGSKSNTDSYEPVPVRSCFGGLTLYKADAFLQPACRYDLYNKNHDVYRGKKEHHTCEHVVLHECLREKYPDFAIAVKPDMITLWHLM